MLAFSNGIILYSSLFGSEETKNLLVRPVQPEYIFLSSYNMAILFSSWAFLFLAAPLMAGFGVSHNLPLLFYGYVALYFLLFLIIPASLGAILCLLVTRFLPKKRRTFMALMIILAVSFGGYKYLQVKELREKAVPLSQKWVEELFAKMEFSKSHFYPSYWLSEGILAASSGDYERANFLLVFVLGNGLFFLTLSFALASWFYRPTFNMIQSMGNQKILSNNKGVSRFLEWLFAPFSKPLAQMLIKDTKTFFRDPVQWSQLFIFLGLLTLYILNVRRLEYHLAKGTWKVLVTYLNLMAVSLTLATFTGRFVFPQVSLEGKRLWILGVFPITRRSILNGKFYFSFGLTFILSELIMGLSCWMLLVPWSMVIANMILMGLICIGLSGLAVGLGAIYPDFQQENPSKIVAGFGGTLNLIVNLIFVISLVVLQFFPFYFWANGSLEANEFYFYLGLSFLISILITLVITLLPLEWGKRVFEKIEI
ncbi:MAG: hypothetical protein D6785_01725 [Planctomycetota bacterium]|nr:MAG: hypothetical protein D6785_01725 [Planctomycetota bacterium]